MEALTDTLRFRAKLQLVQLPLPWFVGVRGAFGFQIRCKFRTYPQANDHVLKWVAAGFERDNISVSHVDDGAELWDLEWAINATRYRRQVEQGKLKPNLQALKVLQEQIQRLYEEVFLLCELRGWAVEQRTGDGGLIRFVISPKPESHQQHLLAGETHPALRAPLPGGDGDFSQIWEKDRAAQLPEDLWKGDRLEVDGRIGTIEGFIGSPAEGVSMLWDDYPSHPLNLWFKDAQEISVVSRASRTYGYLEEAG